MQGKKAYNELKYPASKTVYVHPNFQKHLKINTWSHVFKSDHRVAIYNPLNHEVIYGDKRLDELFCCFKEPTRLCDLKAGLDNDKLMTIRKMLQFGIIVDETFDEQKELERFQQTVQRKFKIDLMYLVLSEECNYSCDYCFVTKDRHKLSCKPLQKKTIASAIDLLLRCVPKETNLVKIVIYGGEPLIHRDLIRFLIIDERKRVKCAQGINIDFELITNGSLVTKSYAKFLSSNDVNISVSLDGWEELHDKRRKKTGGVGTFKESVRGFLLLKEAGCAPGISCTIGDHNIDELEKIVSYFAHDLQPSAIGLNPQLKDKYSPPAKYVAQKIIKAFEVARSVGLYEDRMMKLLQPFVKKYNRLADCGACGNQIVIGPGGRVGVCPAFLGDEIFFPEHLSTNDLNPYKQEVFLEWSKRSPFNIDQCRNCYAISICGGGCPYAAFQKHKTIWKHDEAHCVLSRTVLE